MRQRGSYWMLVDGDRARAERIARRVAAAPLDVRIVGNGAEALLAAHECPPAAIVITSSAPLLNGFLFIEALRSEPRTRQIPVILLTEDCDQRGVTRGWQAGADLCVPLDQGEADVAATLQRALRSLSAPSEASAHDPRAPAAALLTAI